ncbi:MAG: hypothetical protein AUF79_02800 [Crenarchaeota archaeon 13_1_20CM_2_51_8]|nr:MAG: hypothetical protein AUI97_01020 [Crenarchaeota archaeon 13_1_40CM_3_52_17]OLE91723.1 MAG: hypothetical protein AUF79_02800 [Crenarchaeota archaeon 13_1_20CM_2_51_8]
MNERQAPVAPPAIILALASKCLKFSTPEPLAVHQNNSTVKCSTADSQTLFRVTALAQPAKKPFLSSTVSIFIVVIILAVVILGGVFAANYGLHPPISTSVVNGVVTVSPATTQKYTFLVPDGATNAHVTGSFTATGGSGNDIIVYVKDSSGYSLYNSGQVSTGSFSVQLLSGSTYSLVFDNTFSTVSTKTVNAQSTLSYNR